jgi:hypothetical protein
MKGFIYLGLILVVGCSQPKQGGLVYYNDCETLKGWNTANISNEQAHSGTYSNKLDSIHEYGLTLRQSFAEIANEKIKTIKVSVWVFIKPETKGGMVLEVRNKDGKQILWDSQKTDKTNVVPNKWQFVTKDFVLNDSISKPENTIAVYPWCSGKTEFYVDDIRIEFVTKIH